MIENEIFLKQYFIITQLGTKISFEICDLKICIIKDSQIKESNKYTLYLLFLLLKYLLSFIYLFFRQFLYHNVFSSNNSI